MVGQEVEAGRKREREGEMVNNGIQQRRKKKIWLKKRNVNGGPTEAESFLFHLLFVSMCAS